MAETGVRIPVAVLDESPAKGGGFVVLGVRVLTEVQTRRIAPRLRSKPPRDGLLKLL
jgi:hypothetical protein